MGAGSRASCVLRIILEEAGPRAVSGAEVRSRAKSGERSTARPRHDILGIRTRKQRSEAGHRLRLARPFLPPPISSHRLGVPVRPGPSWAVLAPCCPSALTRFVVIG